MLKDIHTSTLLGCARLLVWLSIVFLFQLSASSVFAASQKIGAAQICLAGLIYQYDWMGDENVPRKGMGSYSHSTDDIHVFKSRMGTVLCRVVRNRVLLADARGRWKNGPKDDFYSFELSNDQLIIHRRGIDGAFDQFVIKKSQILTLLPASKTCIPVNPLK